MILVYHVKEPTFGLTRKTWPDDYELVAFVNTSDPDQAFALTQHIDQEWWKDPRVNLVKESRSTSVGDVLADQETGGLLLVEGVGFSILGRINQYTPRYVERPYKDALKLFDEIRNFRPTGPGFAYHDMVVEKLAYHLDSKTEAPVLIPEFLID